MTDTLEHAIPESAPEESVGRPRPPLSRILTLVFGGAIALVLIAGLGLGSFFVASAGNTAPTWTELPATITRLEVVAQGTSVSVWSDGGRAPGVRVNAQVSALWAQTPHLEVDFSDSTARITVSDTMRPSWAGYAGVQIQLAGLPLDSVIVTSDEYVSVSADARDFDLASSTSNIDLAALTTPDSVTVASGGGSIAISVPRGSGPYAIDGMFNDGDKADAMVSVPLDADAPHRIHIDGYYSPWLTVYYQ
jgi:hypothetical protein